MPYFWYTLLGAALLIFAIFTLKSYMKKLAQGCCGSGDAEKSKKIRVKDRDKSHYPYQVVLCVDGMICSHCAQSIENALNQQNGVWASADVDAKKVTVRLKKQPDEQQLRDTVNQIGAYTVMSYHLMKTEGCVS